MRKKCINIVNPGNLMCLCSLLWNCTKPLFNQFYSPGLLYLDVIFLFYRCAGLCVYEGRGGLCSVRLSLPLLKLRPRKDLVETLLVS